MSKNKLICTSCGVSISNIEGSTKFMCPSCGKKLIVRCGECRKLGVRYKCSECGFIGP